MGTAAGHSCSRHNRLTAFRRLITTGRPRPVHPPSPPSSLSPATHCVRANAPPSLHDDHPHPPCRRRRNAARCLPSRRRRCSKYCVRSGPPRPTPRPHHPLGSGRLAHSRPPTRPHLSWRGAWVARSYRPSPDDLTLWCHRPSARGMATPRRRSRGRRDHRQRRQPHRRQRPRRVRFRARAPLPRRSHMMATGARSAVPKRLTALGNQPTLPARSPSLQE